ncbi:MAG TPA: hypothetical protein VF552_16010 [Allosphingosinicella sp.]|jgi:hypothetical protein
MLVILSALLAAHAADAAPAAAPQPVPFAGRTGRVVRLRCHMMECGWHQPLSIEAVRRGEGWVLQKVTARQGRSVHRSETPGRYRRGLPIDWEAPSDHYVLCSRERPAALFRSEDGTWIAHQLNLFDLYGFAYSSAYIYLNACHGDPEALYDERRLRALGYQPGGETRQIELSAPEAILDLPPR